MRGEVGDLAGAEPKTQRKRGTNHKSPDSRTQETDERRIGYRVHIGVLRPFSLSPLRQIAFDPMGRDGKWQFLCERCAG